MQRSALFSLLFLMGLARPPQTERQTLFLFAADYKLCLYLTPTITDVATCDQ
jgi:hypothetical protein